MRRFWFFVALVAALLAVAPPGGCQRRAVDESAPVAHDSVSLEDHAPMKVGVFNSPPYAFPSGGGQWSGLAVTLFQHIASATRLRYTMVEFQSLHEVVHALESGQIDCAAIALTPTPELERKINFTDSFDQSGTSIVIRRQRSLPLLEMIEQIWQSNIPAFTGIVLLILFVFGIIVGFLERRSNPGQFGGGLFKTIGEGIWWSSATMSTVGYGDRVPTTKHGRALGVVWMLISFGLMTMLAGMFSSVLTVQHFNSLIRSPKDLKSVQCGAVEDSAAMLEGRNMGYPMTPYLTTEEALTALSTGEVGAVLGDTVRMRWVLEQPEWTQLVMLPTPIATLFNSFPMSEETHRKTMDAINIELLTIINSPEWEQMRRLYLGDHNE